MHDILKSPEFHRLKYISGGGGGERVQGVFKTIQELEFPQRVLRN